MSKERHYNKDGKYLGWSERDGSKERHYDKDGKKTGWSEWSGDKERQHYDKDGKKVGWSERDGNKERHYNKDGKNIGWSEWSGDKGRHYDKDGKKVGWSESSGDKTRHYDKDGDKDGWREKSSGGGGGGGGGFSIPIPSSLGLLVGFVLIIVLIGAIFAGLEYLFVQIEDNVINKIWPSYETSSEKTTRLKQEWERWKLFSTNSDKWLNPSEATSSIQGSIIFVSHQGGYSIIYSVNPNTSRLDLIKSFPKKITNLSLSPDGDKIAFIAGHDNNEIYVMNSDGTNLRQITKTNNGFVHKELAWFSPSSSILATQQNHPYTKTIWRVGIGENQSYMTIPTYEEYNNKWVPESKKQHFTFYSCESPSVSPDGKKLAFVDNEYSGSLSWAFQTRSQICLKELKSAFGPGQDKKIQLKDLGAGRVQLGPQSWSPDGKKIVFHVSFRENNRIGILESIDRSWLNEPTWLKVPGKNPAWSLDGKWIAFNDEGGTVFIYEIASGNVAKIVGPKFNGKHGENPLWILSAKSTNSENRDERSEVVTIPKYSNTRTTFLRSLDDGKTWDTLLSVDNMPTLAIALIDSMVVNDSQSISVKLRGWVNEAIETEDGGKTWELINYHGRYYGSKTASLRTQDGGRTWQKIDVQYR